MVKPAALMLQKREIVTYSPSWTFIPTHYCRNACGYCAFVKRTGAAAELAPVEAARAEILRAKAAGATELLIMSGEGVDATRHLQRSLISYGFASYLDYLMAVARLALKHDLLPHINVGNLAESDFAALKNVVPSMGMMLESINDNLRQTSAHRRAPDKTPARRLATLHAAGRARMPFTTGLLVGIGESAADRQDTLQEISRIHQMYGHLQEVIVQPFTPHAGTAMEKFPAPILETMRETVGLAREILPAEVAIQIPPNIATKFMDLVAAGARDLGGISPDGDRINPQEPWRNPEYYALTLEQHNFDLTPRLAVYDRFLTAQWLPDELLAAIQKVRRRLPAPTARESLPSTR